MLNQPNADSSITMLNKVPEITLYFWMIKILCTTVGETAADYLNGALNFGLTNTSLVMSILLVIALFFQCKARQYTPSIYWLSVVLLSVVGTLITDNLTDNFEISLVTTTFVFSVLLMLVFMTWYVIEKTLSVHSIVTTRREIFYWLVILFTFALGTAAGDLMAESFHLGYSLSLFIFAGIIAVVAVSYYLVKTLLPPNHRFQSINAILTFWMAYILTRPLGASLGDYLSQTRANGGLDWGSTATSFLFLATILSLVAYLTVTKKDVIQ